MLTIAVMLCIAGHATLSAPALPRAATGCKSVLPRREWRLPNYRRELQA